MNECIACAEPTDSTEEVPIGQQRGVICDKCRAAGHSRLSVNISALTASALREVVTREGISHTEATRRLIGYGHVIWQAARDGLLNTPDQGNEPAC